MAVARSVGPSWFAHTSRATRWQPLLVVTTAATIAVYAFGRLEGAPTSLAVVIAALVLSTAVAALDDPAAEYLHPMPVSARRRLTHRLALVTPATCVAIGLIAWSAAGPLSLGFGATEVVALALSALAAHALVARRLPRHRMIASAVPAGWAIAGVVIERGAVAPLTQAWARWPFAVATVAGVAFVGGLALDEQ